MARIAYVNGSYAPIDAAKAPIEDRGYQFADGVYEVVIVVDGAPWDEDGHLARWRRSLSELAIAEPTTPAALKTILRKVLRLNRLDDAIVYMQATRGTAPRDHAYPTDLVRPSLVVTARRFNRAAADAKAAAGVAAITAPDIRWRRVDIKSISLLPNVMAKDAARRAGAAEAILVRDGVVTEGASSNVWIVGDDGALQTHPLGEDILGGITRAGVLDAARRIGLTVHERAFSLDEMRRAREAFITSATSLVTPVVRLDENPIGDGRPGPIAARLRAAYIPERA